MLSTMQPEEDLLIYISQYCRQFMTEKEKLADRHYFAQKKFFKFRNRSARGAELYDQWATDDADALALLTDGYTVFRTNFTKRILKEHGQELELNLCPECDKIARTPEAQQCRYCDHSWEL
jgi:hypothetical protein